MNRTRDHFIYREAYDLTRRHISLAGTDGRDNRLAHDSWSYGHSLASGSGLESIAYSDTLYKGSLLFGVMDRRAQTPRSTLRTPVLP